MTLDSGPKHRTSPRELAVAPPPERSRMGAAAMHAVSGQRGATARTLAVLAGLVPDELSGSPARHAVAGAQSSG